MDSRGFYTKDREKLFMNKFMGTGNMVRDPEYRSTQNGTPVCNFTIAITRRFKDASGNRPTDFINCVAWRNTAEFINKYFGKGSGIGVTGELQTRAYTDKNGQTRHITEVIVDEAEFNGKAAEKEQKTAEDLFGDELAEFKPLTDDDLPF